jgi:hypothetical protein
MDPKKLGIQLRELVAIAHEQGLDEAARFLEPLSQRDWFVIDPASSESTRFDPGEIRVEDVSDLEARAILEELIAATPKH